MNHVLGFRRGEAVELARVAVGDQDVDAGVDRAVDDRLQAVGSDPVLLVERGDQNARNARESLTQLRIDRCHRILPGVRGWGSGMSVSERMPGSCGMLRPHPPLAWSVGSDNSTASLRWKYRSGAVEPGLCRARPWAGTSSRP